MTKFKDVAHLYLGCKCSIIGSENIKALRSIPFLFGELCAEFGDNTAYDFHEITPILRPLSSMNKIEKSKYEAAQDNEGLWGTSFYADQCESPQALVPFAVMAEIVNQLRKDGFDCDGLIESGEAIEKEVQEA
jgi:hypothetical protein